MKRKVLLPLLMLCIGTFAAATAVGCDKKSSALDTLIGKDSITLEINQAYTLTLDYDGKGTPTWKVEDPTIVSVVNGKLVGLKSGTTTVTVKVGSYTDAIEVTVSALDESKLTLEVSEPNVTLYKGDTKQIDGALKYNGEAFDAAAEKSYESMTPEIVSVDNNGKMTAKAYGDATIIVSYTVGGKKLSTAVNVSVASAGRVEIEQSSLQLHYGDEPATLTAKAYERGAEQANATIAWTATAGQDVIELNGGKVTAKNVGETEVTATYVDKDGQAQTETVTVTVSPIDMDKSDKTVNGISRKKAEQFDPSTSDLGIEGSVIGAYVKKGDIITQITCVDGKIDFSGIVADEWELYLQTRNVTYKVTLVLTIPDSPETTGAFNQPWIVD